MKIRTPPLVLVAVLVVALGSIGAACGSDDDGNGGDTLTLDAYFDRVDGIMDGASENADEIESEMDSRNDAATDIESILDALADGLEDFQRLAEGVRDDLNDVSPPIEVEDQHREFTTQYSVTASALSELRADVDEINPDADEEVIVDQVTDFGTSLVAEFGTLGTQGELICVEMQAIADENEIDIDLECGD